ncbi:MAG: 2-isopropylmalate synthase [Kiritimatiellia bacterium]
MNNRITFFDTTLRDGEQAPGYSMNIEEKLRMARQLEALGVDVLEAGFAIASPGDFESVKRIAETLKTTVVASLCRALEKDIDAAAAAVKGAARPRIHTFLATSDLHLKYKLRLSRDEALARAVAAVRYARRFADDVEFSLEDASRTDHDFMCRVVEAVIVAGATTVNLPDTVGYATPREIYAMVENVTTRVPNIDRAVISMHCHNDLGLAVANTLAGFAAGARQAECCICGIGERAGNAAIEEVVMNLRTRPDAYDFTHGIKTEEITRTAKLLETITGVKTAPNKPIVGANAFAHESGIHQHGILSNAKTYEIMTPESVGAKKTELVLGKHSGAHAFEVRLKQLGYAFDAARVQELFAEFKALADRKKTIADRDLIALAEARAAEMGDPATRWTLEKFVVNTGNRMETTACVSLKRNGTVTQDVAIGNGPVFAAFRAIEKIIDHPFVLEDYAIQAVTEHRDALGEVSVKLSDGTGTYRGRGVSTDIIEGSILACLAAVNKMLDENDVGIDRKETKAWE